MERHYENLPVTWKFRALPRQHSKRRARAPRRFGAKAQPVYECTACSDGFTLKRIRADESSHEFKLLWNIGLSVWIAFHEDVPIQHILSEKDRIRLRPSDDTLSRLAYEGLPHIVFYSQMSGFPVVLSKRNYEHIFTRALKHAPGEIQLIAKCVQAVSATAKGIFAENL